ncbi:MAG: hypothetical protein RJB13_811, partial [Pseudomonadota bacterium]
MFLKAVKRFHHTNRLILWVILGLGFGLMTLIHANRISFSFFDVLQTKTQLNTQDNVALIVVDQKALDQFSSKKGLVFPFPRELFGAVARVAKQFSARAIFYDILFTEPSGYGVSDDENFAELLRESNIPVILPDRGPEGSIRRPVATIVPAVSEFAQVSSINDSDGIYRRYLGGNSVANVTTKLLMNSYPNPAPDFLRYYSESAFPHKNLFEILTTYDEIEDGVPVSSDFSDFKYKVWVVGYSAPGLHDLKPTPIDQRSPGFIIPATGLANALSGHGIQALSLGFSSALIFLSAVLAISVVKLTSTPSWTIVALSSVLLVMPTCLSIAFWFYNYWVSPLPLFAAGICAGGGELLYVYRTVWREQSLMANALKNSMSANMVELVRSGHVKVSRFGELKPVTVLFSDLVGFTEISERLSPHDLVLVLNGYFDEVVNLVTTGQGYVDKFIGDAVMA